jgi:hypothetical protein
MRTNALEDHVHRDGQVDKLNALLKISGHGGNHRKVDVGRKGTEIGQVRLSANMFFFNSPEYCSKGCQADNDPLLFQTEAALCRIVSCTTQRREARFVIMVHGWHRLGLRGLRAWTRDCRLDARRETSLQRAGRKQHGALAACSIRMDPRESEPSRSSCLRKTCQRGIRLNKFDPDTRQPDHLLRFNYIDAGQSLLFKPTHPDGALNFYLQAYKVCQACRG